MSRGVRNHRAATDQITAEKEAEYRRLCT